MLKRVRRNFLELEEKALNCLTEFVLVLPVILHLALVTGVPVGVCFWRRWLLVIVLAQYEYAVLDQDVSVYFQIGLIRVECAELTPLFQKISMLWRNSFAIFEPVFSSVLTSSRPFLHQEWQLLSLHLPVQIWCQQHVVVEVFQISG